jgi:hypothetical protein
MQSHPQHRAVTEGNARIFNVRSFDYGGLLNRFPPTHAPAGQVWERLVPSSLSLPEGPTLPWSYAAKAWTNAIMAH